MASHSDNPIMATTSNGRTLRKYAGELRVGDIWTERRKDRVVRSYRVIAIAPGLAPDHHEGDRRVCDHRAPAHDGLLSGQPGRSSRGADITQLMTPAAGAAGCGEGCGVTLSGVCTASILIMHSGD